MPAAAVPPPLEARWESLMRRCAVAPAETRPLLLDLAGRYGQPGRAYHNLAHVGQVLATVADLAEEARELAAVELAAWFHDAVYDPRAADNEARSAALAGRVLRRLELPEAKVAKVERLILATQGHRPPDDDPDYAVLLDADLAILGAPPGGYDRYAAAIRQEYGWLPADEYQRGRRAILRRFLARPRLYLTAALFARYEAQARQNLAREIATLAAGYHC